MGSGGLLIILRKINIYLIMAIYLLVNILAVYLTFNHYYSTSAGYTTSKIKVAT